MKKTLIFIIILFNISQIPIYSATEKVETSREGICGTRLAQPGPDVICEESQNTCYIKIHFKDGSTGEEDYDSIYIPSSLNGYFDISGVTHTTVSGGFKVNIITKPSTIYLNAANVEQFIDLIENLP